MWADAAAAAAAVAVAQLIVAAAAVESSDCGSEAHKKDTGTCHMLTRLGALNGKQSVEIEPITAKKQTNPPADWKT